MTFLSISFICPRGGLSKLQSFRESGLTLGPALAFCIDTHSRRNTTPSYKGTHRLLIPALCSVALLCPPLYTIAFPRLEGHYLHRLSLEMLG